VLKIEKHAIEKERRENLFCSLFFLDIITNLNGILKTIVNTYSKVSSILIEKCTTLLKIF